MGFNFETVIQIVILMLALRALHMVSANNSCAEVRRNFVAKSIGPMKIVPYNAYPAKDLRVCPNTGLTCCNRAMEGRFQSAAKKEVEKYLEYKTSSLNYNFKSFAEKFQDDVVETFSLSRNITRKVVQQSLRKKINSKSLKLSLSTLDKLYRSLNLQSTPEEVTTAFDKFADRLFLLLLEESYNATHPDIQHEKCVAKQRTDLHPFMDVPTISAANISTALELARSLHEGLAAGATAVNITAGLSLSKSCQKSLTKMRFCAHCFAMTLLKPCPGLCRNVMRGCFAGLTELDQYWNYYVTALADVAERMRSEESKYNVEIALEDFQNKISSSLSVILENITTLRETVEKICKTSRTLKRTRRSTERGEFPLPDSILDDDENEGEKLDLKDINQKNFGKRRQRGRRMRFEQRKFKELMKLKGESFSSSGTPSDAPARPQVRPPHEVLFNPDSNPNKRIWPRKAEKNPIVEKIRSKSQMHNRIQGFISSLNLSVNFYRHLPDDLCSETSAMSIEVALYGDCWNGAEIVKSYTKDVAPVGYEKQAENPEVQVLKVEKEVIYAIEKLRDTTMTLSFAVDKKEVPGVLLHAPVFEPRVKEIMPPINKKNKEFPCDDEDDCKDFGSGGDKDLFPGKEDQSDIEILIGNSKPDNDTIVIDVMEPKTDDVDIDVTFEEDGDEDKKKSKGKRKNQHKKNENRKKERGSHTQPREVTMTTTTSSASRNIKYNPLSWLVCVVLPLLRFTLN